jgi:hypothetical protein
VSLPAVRLRLPDGREKVSVAPETDPVPEPPTSENSTQPALVPTWTGPVLSEEGRWRE